MRHETIGFRHGFCDGLFNRPSQCPWKEREEQHKAEQYLKGYMYGKSKAQRDTVATVWARKLPYEANAAYMIKAVNMHEELLENHARIAELCDAALESDNIKYKDAALMDILQLANASTRKG